jgi:hypothetical protein
MKFTKENPPALAKGWTEDERARCIEANNSVFEAINDSEIALFAGMLAAGKTKLAKVRANTLTDGDKLLGAAREMLSELQLDFTNSIEFEAFAPGTWNGMSFTRSDVQEIAYNFATLEPFHKVPLKFGHNDDQPVTDGQPALGWVTKAWVDQNDKLMLRAENVPDVVKKAIKRKLYRKVSVELDINVTHKGKKYRYVLSGVALLGADIPAVNTLADLDAYMDKSPADRLSASRDVQFTATFRNKSEDIEMTPEDLQKAIKDAIALAVTPIQTQLTALQTENATLKDQNTKFARDKEDLEKNAKKDQLTAHRAKINEALEKGVKEKKILPAQRESFARLVRLDDDTRVLDVKVEDVAQFISQNQGGGMHSSEGGLEGGENAHILDDSTPDVELTRKTNEYMEKSGVTDFVKASQVVMRANPDLARKWQIMNGTKAA